MPQATRQQKRDQNNIVAWTPLDEFSELTDQLGRLLQSQSPNGEGAFLPLADVEETDDSYVIEVEVPGIRREDISIEASGRRIVVSGERKDRERKGKLRRRTRAVGRFYFEATLPGDVAVDATEATLDKGLLTLRVPKAEDDRPRRIAVK
jgi:HSP20 family protein